MTAESLHASAGKPSTVLYPLLQPEERKIAHPVHMRMQCTVKKM